MKILALSLILVSLDISAEVFKINGSSIDFEKKSSVLVSGCEKTCEALKALGTHKKISLKKARAGIAFIGSTGSDVCKYVYKANAVIGVNEGKDQRSFCVFKDQSMLEINSLSDYLEKNKIAQ